MCNLAATALPYLKETTYIPHSPLHLHPVLTTWHRLSMQYSIPALRLTGVHAHVTHYREEGSRIDKSPWQIKHTRELAFDTALSIEYLKHGPLEIKNLHLGGRKIVSLLDEISAFNEMIKDFSVEDIEDDFDLMNQKQYLMDKVAKAFNIAVPQSKELK